MDDVLVDFMNVLRKNGVRISLSESVDATEAAKVVGLSNRQPFKDALRASLVKRHVDIPTYDELFDLFFSEVGSMMGEPEPGSGEGASEADMQQFLELLGQTMGELAGELDELTESLVRNDRGNLDRLLRKAGEEAEVREIETILQVGIFAQRIRQRLNLDRVEGDLGKIRDKMKAKGLSNEMIEEGFRRLDDRLERFREAVRKYVERQLELENFEQVEKFKNELLFQKSFYSLNEDDQRRMREIVHRLAERLKSVVQVRRKRMKRGKFDVKRTFRKNLQYGGVPFRLVFNDRIIDKPELVILCDISDSVRSMSRFFLQFVYSIQTVFQRVRSYIFVAELGEITPLFKNQDVSSAIEAAMWGNIINPYTHSDYGMALKIFHRDHFHVINDKTHVIVIGDGRNNYNAPNDWVLKDIKSRAKSVTWLNPESRGNWGFGDSEMFRYLPHITRAEVVGNLNDLVKAVDRLVLEGF